MTQVQSGIQQIVVDSATSAISIINAGPQGPPGPPGESGQAISFEYDNATPASSHVINHNIGYKPNVLVEEYTTGEDIMCSIIHHSNTQLELQFNIPRAIRARLS